MTPIRQEQKIHTRRRIFDSALALFRSQGVSSTSVDQIVQTAGVSKGAFFVHFPTKSSIFRAYVDMLTETLRPSLPQWLALTTPDGIQHAFDTMTAIVETDRMMLPNIIQAELLGEPWDDGKPSALHELFDPLVKAGQQTGVLRSDLSSNQIVDHLLSTFFIALIWGMRRGEELNTSVAVPMQIAMDGVTSRDFLLNAEKGQAKS